MILLLIIVIQAYRICTRHTINTRAIKCLCAVTFLLGAFQAREAYFISADGKELSEPQIGENKVSLWFIFLSVFME